MAAATDTTRQRDRRRNPIPTWVWIITAAGAVIGAALAKPGDVVGNLLPSAATFAVAGLILAVVAWRVQLAISERRG
jgi:hypothetical protein